MPINRTKKATPNIRAGLEPPSPSITSSADDEDRRQYFIENPEYEFDQLPQPYKTIEKTLEELLDIVWDKIIEFEIDQELEKEKRKLPIFSNPTVIECDIESNEKCCISSDENFVFIAHGSQLKVYDSTSYKEFSFPLVPDTANSDISEATLDTETPSFHIKDLVVKQLPNSISFILILMEESLLSFTFSGGYLFPMNVFGDFDSCLHSSLQVCACEIGTDVNMMAISSQTSSDTNVIDIYQLPIDNWVKEIENLVNQLNEDAKVQQEKNLPETYSSQSSFDEPEETDRNYSSPDPVGPPRMKTSFPRVSLICKIKAPSLSPFNASSLTAALRGVDLEGHTVGSGTNHILSAKYFETMNKQFNVHMKEFLKCDTSVKVKEKEAGAPVATAHFLLPLQNGWQEEVRKSNGLAVWWSGGNQIFIYTLGKSTRDSEYTPFIILPNADEIICSAINLTTSLLAAGLANGNVVVWERSSGKPIHIWNLGVQSKAKKLDFFTLTSTNTFQEVSRLLIASCGGNLYQIIFDQVSNKYEDILPIKDRSTLAEGDVLQILSVASSPTLVCILRANAVITVCDLETKSAVCHFQLPPDFLLAENILMCSILTCNARKLFVLGRQGTEYLDSDSLQLFVFALEGAILKGKNSYCDRLDLLNEVSNSLEKKCLRTLKAHMETRSARQIRQKRRWKEYHRELNLRKSHQISF